MGEKTVQKSPGSRFQGLNPVATMPSEACARGLRSASCLSARMCEFLPTPRARVSRGQPKAELLGALSLVRFFGASKEMNKHKLLRCARRTLHLRTRGSVSPLRVFTKIDFDPDTDFKTGLWTFGPWTSLFPDHLKRRIKCFLQPFSVFTAGLGHFSLAAAAAVHNRCDLFDNRAG